MARMVRATVRGDREIIRNIRRAYQAAGGRALDDNLRDSLQPLKEQTEENARALRNYVGKYPAFFPQPFRGRQNLDRGVRIGRVAAESSLHREYWVAFKGRSRKLAHLVEYGTAPHFQPNFRGGFMHPGASPHPFFRPAFESTKDQVIFNVSRRVWDNIRGSIIQSFVGRR